ncbi:MAG: SpoIIE family protein phosphatase [Polyangiales bacterium]
MEATLIRRWLAGASPMRVVDEASVTLARARARELAEVAAFPDVPRGRAEIIVSELATNQLRHARDGEIVVRRIDRGDIAGLEIIAADRGLGIADPIRALSGKSDASTGLGVGLSAVLRQADELDFDVRVSEGTCVRARVFSRRAPRRREVAIFGRPLAGERVSGDDALFVRDDRHGLTLAVADGLGHGPEAREASARAVDFVRTAPHAALASCLRDANAALAGTRGAVMALLRFDESTGVLEHAIVGNVTSLVGGPGGTRLQTGSSAALGLHRGEVDRPDVDVRPVSAHDLVVVFTDGLTSRLHLEANAPRRHPIVVAATLMTAFARTTDDATIVVVA